MISVSICSPSSDVAAAWADLAGRAASNVFMEPTALRVAEATAFADVRMLLAWDDAATPRKDRVHAVMITAASLSPNEFCVNRQTPAMATMVELDELALSLPETACEMSDDGRPAYTVHGKAFVLHRSQRRDAVDATTGERLDDVLMFRVGDLDEKQIRLSDDRGIYFTTPHFDNYPAVLVRIPDLARLDREELHDLVVEAWLTRVQKRIAKAWLAEHESDDG